MRPLDPGVVDRVVDADYHVASAAAVRYVRAHAARILKELGFWTVVAQPMRSDEIAAALGVAQPARVACDWLVREVIRDGRAVRCADGRSVAIANRAPDDDDLQRARATLDQVAQNIGSSRPIIDYVAGQYVAYLTGRRSPQAILFNRTGMPLWESYFCADNPLYDVHNRLAVAGLHHVWPTLPRSARILEIGTGTAGTTTALIDALAELPGGRDASLMMTDIAPSLLVRAAERLSARGCRLSRMRFDFDRPLEEQALAPGSVDVIVGTNALHASTDLTATLESFRRALSPAGHVVISESTCERGASVHQEFVFNLLPRSPAGEAGVDDAGSRFLSTERWREVLALQDFASTVAVNTQKPELAILAVASKKADALAPLR